MKNTFLTILACLLIIPTATPLAPAQKYAMGSVAAFVIAVTALASDPVIRKNIHKPHVLKKVLQTRGFKHNIPLLIAGISAVSGVGLGVGAVALRKKLFIPNIAGLQPKINPKAPEALPIAPRTTDLEPNKKTPDPIDTTSLRISALTPPPPLPLAKFSFNTINDIIEKQRNATESFHALLNIDTLNIIYDSLTRTKLNDYLTDKQLTRHAMLANLENTYKKALEAGSRAKWSDEENEKLAVLYSIVCFINSTIKPITNLPPRIAALEAALTWLDPRNSIQRVLEQLVRFFDDSVDSLYSMLVMTTTETHRNLPAWKTIDIQLKKLGYKDAQATREQFEKEKITPNLSSSEEVKRKVCLELIELVSTPSTEA